MWHMGDGWGWWMAMGWIWMVVFWGFVVYGIYALTTRRGVDTPSQAAAEPDALEVFARRYARGEITDEQFEAMRARLTGTAAAGTPPDSANITPSRN